ncbi:MAG: hypothetical protein RLZZ383_1014 [Pseudomonadota bacterium]
MLSPSFAAPSDVAPLLPAARRLEVAVATLRELRATLASGPWERRRKRVRRQTRRLIEAIDEAQRRMLSPDAPLASVVTAHVLAELETVETFVQPWLTTTPSRDDLQALRKDLKRVRKRLVAALDVVPADYEANQPS